MAVAVDMVVERLYKLEDYLNKLDKQVHKSQAELNILKTEVLNREEKNYMMDIRQLRGLGKELWKGININEYIQEERKSWE